MARRISKKNVKNMRRVNRYSKKALRGGGRNKWATPKGAEPKAKLAVIKNLCKAAGFWADRSRRGVSVDRFTCWMRGVFKDTVHSHVNQRSGDTVTKEGRLWLDTDLLTGTWNETYEAVILALGALSNKEERIEKVLTSKPAVEQIDAAVAPLAIEYASTLASAADSGIADVVEEEIQKGSVEAEDNPVAQEVAQLALETAVNPDAANKLVPRYAYTQEPMLLAIGYAEFQEAAATAVEDGNNAPIHTETMAEDSKPRGECVAIEMEPKACKNKKDWAMQMKKFHTDKNPGCMEEARERWDKFQKFVSCQDPSEL